MKKVLKFIGIILLVGSFSLIFVGCASEDSVWDTQDGFTDESSNDYKPSGQTFHGYDCTEDCSGHEAGYDWAEEKGITDPDDCGGNSNSFIEGCRAYAEENSY